MANKKIIELDAASQVNSDAVFPLSQLVGANQKTLKATIAQIQSAVLAPVSSLATLGEASGAIASFATDISDKLFSCYVNVVASQAGSGTPAPDNVRAISGWSACNLTGCGYNVWNESTEIGNIDNSTGEDTPSNNILRTKGYIVVKPNTNYYVKTPTDSGKNLTVFFYDVNKNFISLVYKQNDLVTTPVNSMYMRFKIGSAYGTTYNNDISINYPSTDTSYHKYNGTTHTIPFGQTVYGGVLDVLSGVLTVTHGRVDLGSLSWLYTTGTGSRMYCDFTMSGSGSPTDKSDIVCEMFETATSNEVYSHVYDNIIAYDNSGNHLWCYSSSYTDANDFTIAVTGKYLVYKLATPITIQLTPTEVKTILGQNNIFGDCGDIDLKYLETIGNRL